MNLPENLCASQVYQKQHRVVASDVQFLNESFTGRNLLSRFISRTESSFTSGLMTKDAQVKVESNSKRPEWAGSSTCRSLQPILTPKASPNWRLGKHFDHASISDAL